MKRLLSDLMVEEQGLLRQIESERPAEPLVFGAAINLDGNKTRILAGVR